MCVFGRNGQVQFNSEEELRIAVDYIINNLNNNVLLVHEDNQDQGAWGPEERIHFQNEEGIPNCLKRNMTAGRPGLYGRINCKEFCEYIRNEINRRGL